MPRFQTRPLFSDVVRGLRSRWWPREPQPPVETPRWEDTDRSWHHSSFELSRGVEVVEHFEPPPVFPDTLPGIHLPPAARAVMR